eukprot:7520510-Alexandrium_andersonii.AAC.1
MHAPTVLEQGGSSELVECGFRNIPRSAQTRGSCVIQGKGGLLPFKMQFAFRVVAGAKDSRCRLLRNCGCQSSPRWGELDLQVALHD